MRDFSKLQVMSLHTGMLVIKYHVVFEDKSEDSRSSQMHYCINLKVPSLALQYEQLCIHSTGAKR